MRGTNDTYKAILYYICKQKTTQMNELKDNNSNDYRKNILETIKEMFSTFSPFIKVLLVLLILFLCFALLGFVIQLGVLIYAFFFAISTGF